MFQHLGRLDSNSCSVSAGRHSCNFPYIYRTEPREGRISRRLWIGGRFYRLKTHGIAHIFTEGDLNSCFGLELTGGRKLVPSSLAAPELSYCGVLDVNVTAGAGKDPTGLYVEVQCVLLASWKVNVESDDGVWSIAVLSVLSIFVSPSRTLNDLHPSDEPTPHTSGTLDLWPLRSHVFPPEPLILLTWSFGAYLE